jgi:hypothetical protein
LQLARLVGLCERIHLLLLRLHLLLGLCQVLLSLLYSLLLPVQALIGLAHHLG